MIRASSPTGPETKPGCPAPAGAMTSAANLAVSIAGWNCRRPSSSHSSPSTIWMPRRVTRDRAGTAAVPEITAGSRWPAPPRTWASPGARVLDPQIAVDPGRPGVELRRRPEGPAGWVAPPWVVAAGVGPAAVTAGVDDGPGRAGEVALQLLAPGDDGPGPLEVRHVGGEPAAVADAGLLQRPGQPRRLLKQAGVAGVQVDPRVRQSAQRPHRVPEQPVALPALRGAQAVPEDVGQAIGFHDDDVIARADGRRQLADPVLVARRRHRPAGRELAAGIAVGQVVGDDHRDRVSPGGRPRHLRDHLHLT